MLPRAATLALLLAALATTAPLVAADADPATEPDATSQPRTLFDRMGGTYTLAHLVDDFVDTMLADPAIRANTAVRDAIKPSHKAGLKFQITSLLCQETGGPCKYQGKSLRETHMGMAITAHQWRAVMRDFKAAMVRAKISAAEREELSNVVAASKGDIVTTSEK